jgi:dTDP-glucose 4,6-dehydratase
MRVLVTGGAGFIGSAFVRLLLSGDAVTALAVLDKLSYAGNLENLEPVAGDSRFHFVRGDICDEALVNSLFEEFRADAVVHFAAESHVDRSILAPQPAFETNLRGTFTLLEAARMHRVGRFLHVSTDEVYGSLPEPLIADEEFPLRPASPYSASKAGSDLLAMSYFHTYKLPVVISRASNNYGPCQFPEKLIPLMILNALDERRLPVYGDGKQVRDWLFVDDHCRALAALVEHGREGEVYNIGGSRSLPNLEVVRKILRAVGRQDSLIDFVRDRPGHDRRYALASEKIMRETDWRPEVGFEEGLSITIAWYGEHQDWVGRVKSGEYQMYYDRNYRNRELELDRLQKN